MKLLTVAALLLGIASFPAWAADQCPTGQIEFGSSVYLTSNDVINDCLLSNTLINSDDTIPTAVSFTNSEILSGTINIYFATKPTVIVINNVRFATGSRLMFYLMPPQGSSISITDSYFGHYAAAISGSYRIIDFNLITSIGAGVPITISRNTFSIDVTSALNTNTVVMSAIYFSTAGVTLAAGSSISVTSNYFRIQSNNVANVHCLYLGGTSFSGSRLINQSAVSFSGNTVLRTDAIVATSGKATGAYIRLSLLAGSSSPTVVTVSDNTFDGVEAIARIFVNGDSSADIRQIGNTASYPGNLTNQVYVYTTTYPTSLTFKENVLRTYNDYGYFAGQFGPSLSFGFSILRSGSSVQINDNTVAAAAYKANPFRFPLTSDIERAVSVQVMNNVFMRSTVASPTVALASFAYDVAVQNRTVLNGAVFICYNTWPPTYAAATTTTTVLTQSTSTSTRGPTTTRSTTATTTTTTPTTTTRATTTTATTTSATTSTTTPISTTTSRTTTTGTTTTSLTTTATGFTTDSTIVEATDRPSYVLSSGSLCLANFPRTVAASGAPSGLATTPTLMLLVFVAISGMWN
eukprot:GILI01005421.1.p1 GENE.GILI01005421.1~~GILI01005421.1.p1  ORF type:complete len:578 (-),score=100.93 GILI01005421.1:106-1839(-)